MIATLADVLGPALAERRAVPGLVVLGWEDAVAFARAGGAANLPIILQAGPGCRAHTPLTVLGAMFRHLAETTHGPGGGTSRPLDRRRGMPGGDRGGVYFGDVRRLAASARREYPPHRGGGRDGARARRFGGRRDGLRRLRRGRSVGSHNAVAGAGLRRGNRSRRHGGLRRQRPFADRGKGRDRLRRRESHRGGNKRPAGAARRLRHSRRGAPAAGAARRTSASSTSEPSCGRSLARRCASASPPIRSASTGSKS